MKKVLIFFLLITCSVAFSATFKKGQKLYVSTKSGQITQNESNHSEKIANVFYGDKVIVIESNEKKTKVKLDSNDSKIGWIANGSLTKKKIIASGNGMGTTKVDEIAIAGKGFSEEAENAYKASNPKLDFRAVDKIEKINVSKEELKKFIEEGKLETQEMEAKK